MLTKHDRSEGRSVAVFVATGLLSVLYAALAIRFGLRIGSSDLNASARGFFVSALSATIVLYSIAVIQAVVQRDRPGALIPVCLAAVFGSFVCVIFFGP